MSTPQTERIVADEKGIEFEPEGLAPREESDLSGILEIARLRMRQRAARKPKPSDSGPIRLS